MYITVVPNRNSPPAILLRESYRSEDGKVRNKTIANLSKWDKMRIEALKRVLKGEFDSLEGIPEVGESFGTLFLLKHIAKEVGIISALGKGKQALLSLFLVLARFVHQGSRLSCVRWAKNHAVSDILGLDVFDENHLYKALEWLEENQEKIEKNLFKLYLKKNKKPLTMVLYDVTSSYFEGVDNELAEYGYNRDKKKGKKQIVIGLLNDDKGEPLAVRVFKGNTADPSTVYDQINIVKTNFGIKKIVFVGDKGMIRSRGKEALTKEGFEYITSISKLEIESLERDGVIQYSFFEKELHEVCSNGKRYVLRKNEDIARKLVHDRQNRLDRLMLKVNERNLYVEGHKRSRAKTGLVNFTKLTKEWRLDGFVSVTLNGDKLEVNVDEDQRKELFLLDGCYAIETNVSVNVMDKGVVDETYHRLHEVEECFCNMKTGLLEVRPIFLRKSNRTKGHVFVCMLALKVWQYMKQKLKEGYGVEDSGLYNMTIEETLNQLDKYSFLYYTINGKRVARLSRASESQRYLFNVFGIKMKELTKCSQ